jgi:hypothetical protein
LPLWPFACPPPEATLARTVTPAPSRRTNTSTAPLVSPTTRLEAIPVNATESPSPEIAWISAPEGGCAPPTPTPARVVVPLGRSRTNTSSAPLVSPATRLLAVLWKTTRRPSPEIRPGPLASLPWFPADPRLTRVVVPACRSRTKTSMRPLVSPGTRLDALLVKAT